MLNLAVSQTYASDVLTALGVLAVAQEQERPAGELDALTDEVLSALDNYRDSRDALAA